MKYTYNKDLIKYFVQDNTDLFYNYNSNINKSYTDLKEPQAKYILEKMKDQLYLIDPHPAKDTTYIVYEYNNKDAYFCEFNQSRDIQRHFKKHYKTIFYQFMYYYSYNRFITNLDHYKEQELTSKNILLNDGYIYNFESMEFKKYCYEIPTQETKQIYKELKEKDKKILDQCFNVMFDTDKKFEQFLYYILCNFNKDFSLQSIFLVIDNSSVGKSARLEPFNKLRLNSILDSRVLAKSELYNIAYRNSIICNELQNETIIGTTLNNFADNTSLEVTRKNKGSLLIDGNDKPLLQLIGESLPYIKGLHNGTNRRLLLVPKVSKKFKKFKEKEPLLMESFYSILYNKPIETLQYYINCINERKIQNKTEIIKKDMKITIQDLENLAEDKDNIFKQYINLNPLGKYDETPETRYLLDKKSLELVLQYIDYNIITVSHFANNKLRIDYIRNAIKENTDKQITKLGYINRSIDGIKYNFFFAYCLTKKGVELVKQINQQKIFDQDIIYYEYNDYLL